MRKEHGPGHEEQKHFYRAAARRTEKDTAGSVHEMRTGVQYTDDDPADEPAGSQPRTGGAAALKKPTNIKEFVYFYRRNILILGVVLLLIVALLLVMLIPSCGMAEEETSLPESVAEETDGLEEEYDPAAFALSKDAYVDTILPETEDAGQEYVDDTLFLGDSNTVRMLSYRDMTGVTFTNAIGVEGMGIHDFTTYQCVKYAGYPSLVTMPEAVAIVQPRRVVITFGTNNVGGMGVEKFIEYYEGAIEAVQESYEYADIIIGAVFPVDINCAAPGITMTKVDQYNMALAELADQTDCKFLYWSEALADENSGYAQSHLTISDGYHISRDGMEELFDYFRCHSYITEDDRPKPLKDIPERLEADVALIKNDGNTDTLLGQSSVPASSYVEPSSIVETTTTTTEVIVATPAPEPETPAPAPSAAPPPVTTTTAPPPVVTTAPPTTVEPPVEPTDPPDGETPP